MKALRTYRAIRIIFIPLLILACGAIKITHNKNISGDSSNLVTLNGIYDGDITPEELQSTTRFKVFPDTTIGEVISYKILSFSKGTKELLVNSDSLTQEAKEFILHNNRLGNIFYITDIAVNFQNSFIDTLNSISLRLVPSTIKKQKYFTNRLGLRAIADSKLLPANSYINDEGIKIELYQEDYKIIKFTCILPNCDNYWRVYSCRGDTIPHDMLDEIKRCGAGSYIIFEDIVATGIEQDTICIPPLIKIHKTK